MGNFLAASIRSKHSSSAAARFRPSLRLRWCRSAIKSRFAGQVVASNPHLATISVDERGEDMHCGGLARAVGTEQREDGSLGHVQVDAVEDHVFAKSFAQSPCFNHHQDTSIWYNRNH